MMLFWTLSAIGLATATLLTCLPLFRHKSGWTPIALALVFALPAGALMLYQDVGTPEAIDLSGVPQASTAGTHAGTEPGAGEIDDLVNKLRSRLDESPESLEGWVLLARTLKTMQRFPEALEALQTAKRIAPDDPFVTVELVEAQLFMSQGGMISEEMIGQLQAALDQDPGQQKALWLMGVAAAQAGEDEAAISYWETLLNLVEADSPIQASVQEQISAARSRLGIEAPQSAAPTMPPPPAMSAAEPSVAQVEPQTVSASASVAEQAAPVDSGPWNGIEVQVTPGAAMGAGVPQNAVLFVMIRTPGVAAGPPIGVRRVIGPALPLTMTISDRDSMLQERQISSESQLQLQARLSLSGSPGARSGDWQSQPVTVSLDSAKSVELVIDQQVE